MTNPIQAQTFSYQSIQSDYGLDMPDYSSCQDLSTAYRAKAES